MCMLEEKRIDYNILIGKERSLAFVEDVGVSSAHTLLCGWYFLLQMSGEVKTPRIALLQRVFLCLLYLAKHC